MQNKLLKKNIKENEVNLRKVIKELTNKTNQLNEELLQSRRRTSLLRSSKSSFEKNNINNEIEKYKQEIEKLKNENLAQKKKDKEEIESLEGQLSSIKAQVAEEAFNKDNEITINDRPLRTITLTSSDNWYHEFNNLPTVINGKTVAKYTVSESGVPTGYTSNTTGNQTTGYTITNTHEDETIDLVINKTWDDYDDVSQIRPNEITVDLYADDKLLDRKSVV